MSESVSFTMSVTDQADKKMTRSITDVDPSATDSQIVALAEGLNSLTTNTLSNISRVAKKDLDPTITYYDPIWDFGNDLGVLTVDGNTITATIAQLPTTLDDAIMVELKAKIGTTPNLNIPTSQIFKTIKVEFVPGADAQYTDQKECCFGALFAYNEISSPVGYFNVLKPYAAYDQPCTIKITLPAGSFIVNTTTYYYNESVVTVNFV